MFGQAETRFLHLIHDARKNNREGEAFKTAPSDLNTMQVYVYMCRNHLGIIAYLSSIYKGHLCARTKRNHYYGIIKSS